MERKQCWAVAELHTKKKDFFFFEVNEIKFVLWIMFYKKMFHV